MEKKTKKRGKAVALSLAMASFVLAWPHGASAQEGLFQRGAPIGHHGHDGGQGLLARDVGSSTEGNFFHQAFGFDDEGNFTHQTFGADDEGNFVHQTFGNNTPTGSGLLILLSAGVGYAATKRKKQDKKNQQNKKNQIN